MKIKVKKLWNIFINIILGITTGIIGTVLFMGVLWFFCYTTVGIITLFLLMIGFFGYSFTEWFREIHKNDL